MGHECVAGVFNENVKWDPATGEALQPRRARRELERDRVRVPGTGTQGRLKCCCKGGTESKDLETRNCFLSSEASAARCGDSTANSTKLRSPEPNPNTGVNQVCCLFTNSPSPIIHLPCLLLISCLRKHPPHTSSSLRLRLRPRPRINVHLVFAPTSLDFSTPNPTLLQHTPVPSPAFPSCYRQNGAPALRSPPSRRAEERHDDCRARPLLLPPARQDADIVLAPASAHAFSDNLAESDVVH